MLTVGPEEIRREIDRFVREVWTAGLARDSNAAVMRTVPGGRISVAWRGAERLSIDFAERPSLADYIALVKDRQYTLLLSDYSFLQIAYMLDGKQIVKHRLVYYPCPIIVTHEEAAQFGIVDLLELLDETELLDRFRQESPFRFEFNPDTGVQGHSASHVHVSRESCRIPVYAPLTLGRFIRFVFCHFYPTEWNTYGFLRTWPFRDVEPCILEEERQDLHLTCVERRAVGLLRRLLGGG